MKIKLIGILLIILGIVNVTSVYAESGVLIENALKTGSDVESDSSIGRHFPNQLTKIKNDTRIKELFIDGKEIILTGNTAEYVAKSKKIDIVVRLKNNDATYEIQGDVKNLSKEKVNEIKILVTAKDGNKRTYTLNITREDNIGQAICTIVVVVISGVAGYSVYRFIAKKKVVNTNTTAN